MLSSLKYVEVYTVFFGVSFYSMRLIDARFAIFV